MWRTIELLLVFLAAIFIITQFLIPAIRGTRSLPLFFSAERKLNKEMADIKQLKLETELTVAIDEEKKRILNAK